MASKAHILISVHTGRQVYVWLDEVSHVVTREFHRDAEGNLDPVTYLDVVCRYGSFEVVYDLTFLQAYRARSSPYVGGGNG